MAGATTSVVSPHAESRQRGFPVSLALMLFLVLCVVFFVPKLNVLPIPGFSVEAKPEDLLWLLFVPLLLYQRVAIDSWAQISWIVLLAYIVVSTAWHPTNSILAIRFFFYSFPFLFGLVLSGRQVDAFRRLAKWFLCIFAVVALLQYFAPVPAFHTGELVWGPLDRPPGVFGNGVEFALVAFFAFWLVVIAGDRSVIPWLAALIIVIISGTRVVSVLLLLSGIVFVWRLDGAKRAMFVIALALAALVAVLWAAAFVESTRLAELDVALLSQVLDVFAYATPSQGLWNSDGYCFEFDDSLAADQSLAMRLSKLLFVTEYVVLGDYPLGFGLGQCIGDAGDNLFVRVLSDGGLPYFGLLVLFLLAVGLTGRDRWRSDWVIFTVGLWGVSMFYDTLYFSRTAPLIFAILVVARSRHLPTIRASSVEHRPRNTFPTDE